MADITSDDYYKVLGVSRDATENDISRRATDPAP